MVETLGVLLDRAASQSPGREAVAYAPRERVTARLAHRLASYKVPRHVFVVRGEDLPVTVSGRIEKPALRREAERRVGGGS
jgi:acyl-CoA synthetase (AMP-forming)/AMP-acid ligase II